MKKWVITFMLLAIGVAITNSCAVKGKKKGCDCPSFKGKH